MRMKISAFLIAWFSPENDDAVKNEDYDEGKQKGNRGKIDIEKLVNRKSFFTGSYR